MARLEDLSTGTRLTGLAASGSATVESAQWIGEQALKVIYRDGDGQLSDRLLYRDDEPSLELVEMGRPWSFDGDLLRLVSEAYRSTSLGSSIPTSPSPPASSSRPSKGDNRAAPDAQYSRRLQLVER